MRRVTLLIVFVVLVMFISSLSVVVVFFTTVGVLPVSWKSSCEKVMVVAVEATSPEALVAQTTPVVLSTNLAEVSPALIPPV